MLPTFRRSLIHDLRHVQSIQTRFFAGPSFKVENGLLKFPLTDIGEGIKEVELREWFVETGTKINEFDRLCEVMSDKANVEITSPIDGIVHELHWKVGEMAQVGLPLVTFKVEVDPNETDSAAETPPTHETKSEIKTTKIQTTPAVRRIAKENNIDLTKVVGTGPNNRILKEDVLRYLKNPSVEEAAASSQKSTPTPIAPVTTTITPILTSQPPPRTAQDKTVPIMGVQRMMVKKMNEANQVPQFGYGDDVCMDKLMALRKEIQPAAEKLGVKLSFLPFILKATSLALIEYPILNAHVNPECTEIYHKASHNIGIAVDTPQGLVVPNIKNCQNKSIFQIAQDIDNLIKRVRENKTSTEDISGGTFTLSNIGAIGGTVCRPIVVVPEVCIGALGKTQKLPMYNAKDEIVPKNMMHASWSADHRVIDGATVARFSNQWKTYIENPTSMLLHLS